MAFINTNSIILFFILSLASIVSSHIPSNYVDFDDFLKKRANEVHEAALKAYNPDPEGATKNFNYEVDETLFEDEKNATKRRTLEEVKKECKVTNPIDRCFRCWADWADDRQRLADCARGFGYRTTGGKGGRFYVVTDNSDDDMLDPKPGTFRHAVIQEEPLWIIFAKSMVIRLTEELLITSNKTIDGRGANVHIADGAGITIQYVENVIIHNIRIYNIIPAPGGLIRDSVYHFGLRTVSDGDGITIFGAINVWIDHVSLSNCTDGLIDAIMASTAITISNCKFNNHNDVMLLGAQDEHGDDKIMQVTVAFNRFGHGLIQRMPRCRWGFFHVVNNDYNHWEKYAIGGSAHPTIISQGNRFRASNNPHLKEVTHRDYATESEWKTWQWRSEGDMFKNGAFFIQSGPSLKHSPLSDKNRIIAKPGTYAGRLTRYAGQRKCKVGKPC